MLLRGLLTFVMRHKLVCAVGIVSIPAALALLAYERRQETRRPKAYPPVRDAVDEPVAPPSLNELEVVPGPQRPWAN